MMSPVFLPRPGRRQTPGRDKRHRSEDTAKGNAEKAQRQQHVRASREDHATSKPRSRDRAAGQKDQPEPPGEKQTMRTTRGSTMQPELTNRPTMTPFMPMPPTKKQVNTLASTPPATHIRTVPKPSLTNRGRTKATFSTSGGFRTKAASALQTTQREPRICTPARDGGKTSTPGPKKDLDDMPES